MAREFAQKMWASGREGGGRGVGRREKEWKKGVGFKGTVGGCGGGAISPGEGSPPQQVKEGGRGVGREGDEEWVRIGTIREFGV